MCNIILRFRRPTPLLQNFLRNPLRVIAAAAWASVRLSVAYLLVALGVGALAVLAVVVVVLPLSAAEEVVWVRVLVPVEPLCLALPLYLGALVVSVVEAEVLVGVS